ncbi:hypothetical protein PFISCL1PPCAC_7002, partial [Pristionchus fissidentatus]
ILWSDMKFLLVAIVVAALFVTAESKVTCTMCGAVGKNDLTTCSGNRTCTAAYCLYERTTLEGVTNIMRTCSPNGYAFFPDGSKTTTLNKCEKKTVGEWTYAFEVCNSGNDCGAHCD